MAAQISHILAGDTALEAASGSRGGASEKAAAILGEAAPYFRLGCQGPDIFYHNQRTKPSGLHYGALAHRRRYGSLVAGAAAALPGSDRRPDSPAGAYLLGLATHAAIDRATHPFIVFFSGWVDPSDPATQRFRGCHPFLERVLDMGLLERRLGLSPVEFGLAAKLGAGTDELESAYAGIGALWSAALRAAYPRATGTDGSLDRRIANALLDARHFYAVTDPAATAPGGERDDWLRRLGPEEGRRLASLVYPLAYPAGMDAMNEARAEWPHPAGDGRRSTASYLDLIDEGSREAAKAISALLDSWRRGLPSSASETERLSGLIGEGGLALCDEEGSPLAPKLCRPLALSEAMDEEYARRIGAYVDVSARGRYDAQHEHEG